MGKSLLCFVFLVYTILTIYNGNLSYIIYDNNLTRVIRFTCWTKMISFKH